MKIMVNPSSDLNLVAISKLKELVKTDDILKENWKEAALQMFADGVVPASIAELEKELEDVGD